MSMTKETAGAIKTAVGWLHENPNGQVLLEFLEEASGKYTPSYDPNNSTSVILAAGRSETMQTLRNLERLTMEQIVKYYENQEGE